MTETILDRIVQSTRRELERRKRVRPLESFAPAGGGGERAGGVGAAAAAGGNGGGGRFRAALAGREIGAIAEVKRRSPSAGPLREGLDVAGLAREYERGGASAISVLTEELHFGGSLEDLVTARAACGLPILRKDFVVDSYQLHEAVAAGADAVLLIVAALSDRELLSLREEAVALGLDVLVEVHDEEELERALAAGAVIVGINNRDLRDFTVDVERTYRLMELMPEGTVAVSESGIARPEQLVSLRRAGVSAVLVGEALMRAKDPQDALRALLASSRGPGRQGAA